jgi:hypothetical protein
MNASERLDIINYLAAHPKAGDLMEGTGGIRKLRWGRGAVTFHHIESNPFSAFRSHPVFGI